MSGMWGAFRDHGLLVQGPHNGKLGYLERDIEEPVSNPPDRISAGAIRETDTVYHPLVREGPEDYHLTVDGQTGALDPVELWLIRKLKSREHLAGVPYFGNIRASDNNGMGNLDQTRGH